MKTIVAVFVALVGLVCGRIGDYYPKSGGYYPSGGYSHSGDYYPGSVYPHGGSNYPSYPVGGGSNYPYPGPGYPYPGHGSDLDLPPHCNSLACIIPACQVTRCRNFPLARCVGFCNSCVARFFFNGVNVTRLCGGSTGPGPIPGKHKKNKSY